MHLPACGKGRHRRKPWHVAVFPGIIPLMTGVARAPAAFGNANDSPHAKVAARVFHNRPTSVVGAVVVLRHTGVMHIFIDDSGDGGFKFGAGSSSHLVMAACVFRDPLQIEELKECMENCAWMNGLPGEFKYAKTKERVKDCFFGCTRNVKFRVRTIIIDKAEITSPKLMSSPSALKSFAIRQLLTHGFGRIHNAKVVIDGQDTRAFGITDQSYLMKMANREHPGTVTQVTWADSKQNVGIQLADMVAGAINRGVRTHKPKDPKHLKMIRWRTYYPEGSYWMFRSPERRG